MPAPSVKPELPPATVVTAPLEEIRRTREPETSPTSTLDVAGSNSMPCGLLNVADAPCPSAEPEAPLPASVLTFQRQKGGAVRPLTVHAVAGKQGSHAAGAAAYVPTGHEAAVYEQDNAPCSL